MRRVRRFALLVTLVTALMAGAAPAAFGHGDSHDAKCEQAASNTTGPNYNPATATADGTWSTQTATAWNNGQNAWSRCDVTANE